MKSEIMGVDVYNMTITGGVCMTIRSKAGDNEHIPCVLIRQSEPIAFTTEMTPKVDGGGV